jgi:hypothetical protein
MIEILAFLALFGCQPHAQIMHDTWTHFQVA